MSSALAALEDLPEDPFAPLEHAPFRRVEVADLVRVEKAEKLTDIVPLVAPDLARTFRQLVSSTTEPVTVVEVVDLSSALSIARAAADSQGKYRLRLPAGSGQSLVVQTGVVRSNRVAVYLAAPVVLRVAAAVVDISPGSTTLALSLASLSGVRGELRTDTGFKSFKSQELLQLVAAQDSGALAKCASAIDLGGAFAEVKSATAVLSLSGRSSGVFARETVNTASQVTRKLDTVVAASKLIVAKLPSQATASADLGAAIVRTADSVKPADVSAEAEKVRAQADAGAILDRAYGQTYRSGYQGKDWRTPRVTAFRILAGPEDKVAQGHVEGAASDARFNFPTGVAVARDGTVYVADSRNYRIRRIRADGQVDTLAGDGQQRVKNDVGTAASFHNPFALAMGLDGGLLIAESLQSLLRRVAPDKAVTTVIGEAGAGASDGPAGEAQVSQPTGLAVDVDGAFYVADTQNHRIRKLDRLGRLSTVAGSTKGQADGLAGGAQFNAPLGVAVDAEGTLYVSDTENRAVRAILPGGRVETVAGNGQAAKTDGKGQAASFVFPRYAVSAADGTLYVADSSWLRVVAPDGTVTTLLGTETGVLPAGGLVAADTPFEPAAMALAPDGKLIVADASNHRIIAITLGN